jgi:hypothetical protein
MRRFVLALVLAGCPSSPGSGGDMARPRDLSVPDLAPPPPFCVNGVDGGPPATLASVETVLDRSCTAAGCHGATYPAVMGLDLRRGHVIASTVNQAAVSTCGGVRVVPGDPMRSFLYRKLDDAVPCDFGDMGMGLQMPRCEDGSCPLPDCEIDVIRRWILAGAPSM